jgi:hypothetical protein
MKDVIVSFKTAKLARKKGLDTELDLGGNCTCYLKNGEVTPYHVHFHFPNRKEYIYAPTQSFLQKWLREKHGLILYVEYTGIVNLKWRYHIYGRRGVHVGNSYEECLEAGLQDALKLIKP